MIKIGNELIRIHPSKCEDIQYSIDNGNTWITRYSGNSVVKFSDLADSGGEILANTSKGLYYSTNKGYTWTKI